MEVALDRDQLLKGLQMIQNVVEPRQATPILANVLLETEPEALRMTATDIEIAARVSVPARVAAPGAITVSARKLGEIVRELAAASLALKVGDSAAVSLRCGGATYRLVGLGAEEFPPVVPASPPAWLGVEARTLREMLAQTSFAVSHDETRYALGGVLFAFQPGELRLVATDGHRLAVSSRAVGQGLSGVSGIVPRKAVTEVARVLGTSETVHISITENQFLLRMPSFELTARLIEGQFPNYEAVVPRSHPERLTAARGDLAAALRRVSIMAEERNRPVRLTMTAGRLTVAASSHDLGEAEETLEVAYEGPEIAMGFNARYVLDALGPVEGDQVLLELKDPLSPAVVRSAASEGYCCVIMPMRIS